MRITVIGAGPLGCSHAAALAEWGYEVLASDLDPARVAMLNQGRTPLFEPELDELIARHTGSGRLRFTTEMAEIAAFGTVHFVCVGTPQRDSDGAADMRQVDTAVADLVARLHGQQLVVLKSTVPVGTSARLLAGLDALATPDADLRFAFNGEFLREGHAVHDALHPDRIVIGSAPADDRSAHLLRQVYAEPIAEGSPVIDTDFATAELVKTSANAFLVTKISFINAMADLCEATGGDVSVLADAIGHDARIGRQFLDAGLGYGGGCLPKDVRAFMARAGEIGVGEALTFLREVDAINTGRRTRVVEIARELVGGRLAGQRVAVLGAAFKADSDDVRDSPVLDVAGQLHLHGAQVAVYDPKALPNARRVWPTLGYADSTKAACADADLVVLGTAWQEFRDLDPAELATVVARPVMLDGRNVLDPARWRAAGWTYRGLGRP